MENPKSIGLPEFRLLAGKPSSQEEDEMLSRLPALRQSTLQLLDNDKEILKNGFEELRNSLSRIRGTDPSRPFMIGYFIETTIGKNIEHLFFEALNDGDHPMFRLLFDFRQGFAVAISRIRLAEEFITGELDTPSDVAQSLDDQIDVHLNRHRHASRGLRSLQEDPTGLKVFDDYLQELQSGERDLTIADFSSIPYISAGAEFAREIYRKVYPLSA